MAVICSNFIQKSTLKVLFTSFTTVNTLFKPRKMTHMFKKSLLLGALVLATSFSVAVADNNKLFLISSSTAVTVTIPTGLPIGFSCQFIQTGAGGITLLGSSVTLNSANGLTSRSQNSAVGLVMSSSSVGYVFGDTMN